MKISERVMSIAFELYCKEGHLLYNLTTLAGGEYASDFTERAWKTYERGMIDCQDMLRTYGPCRQSWYD